MTDSPIPSNDSTPSTDPVQAGVRVHRDGPRLTVTLARPEKRNAQTPSMWARLTEIARTLDDGVRVVVLNADGPDFSAGLDRGMLSAEGLPGEPQVLSVVAHRGVDETEKMIAGFQHAFTAWSEVDALVVAAVQGNAIGAGFQLALGADLRLVAEDVRLAIREPSLGLVPDLGGTLPLVRTLGYSRALEICVTGRFIGAQEAVGAGLATLASPNDRLAAVTDEVVAAILEVPDRALRETKRLLRAAISNDAEAQLLAERQAQARLLAELAPRPGTR